MTTLAPDPSDRRRALALALGFVALLVVAQLAIAAALALLGGDMVPPRAAAALGQVVGILLPALLVLPRARGWAASPLRVDGLGALVVASAIPLAWVTGAATQVATIAALQDLGWTGLDAARQRVAEAYGRVLSFDDATSAAVTVLLVCIVAPIVEEFAFRGVLQPLLVRVIRPGAAIAVTALAFAALHFEPLGLLPRVLLGIGCGVFAHRLGTLPASMAVHAGFNGISLALVAAVGTPAAMGVRPAPEGALVPALIIGAGAAVAFLGLASLAPLGSQRDCVPPAA